MRRRHGCEAQHSPQPMAYASEIDFIVIMSIRVKWSKQH